MRKYTLAIIAAYISAGCATSCLAAGSGGGGGFGGGGGGGSPSYVMDSRLLYDAHKRPQVTIEQVRYVWADWYKSDYDALETKATRLSFVDDSAASQQRLAGIQSKQRRMRLEFARQLKNHNILVTPRQVMDIATD